MTAWLHALDAAGARPRTRARMLSGTAREPSPTVRLTAVQVRALLDAAAGLPDRTRPAALYRSRAVDAYLAERDRTSGDGLPVPRGRSGSGAPLVARRDGTRCTRCGLYALLRRVARSATPSRTPDRHALRHAYVTIALEHDARIQHVQADVGHASVATTQHYDRGLRTRAASAADVVSEAIHGAVR